MAKLETKKDRWREAYVIALLMRRFGGQFKRYSDSEYAGLDWVWYVRGVLRLVLELKCRQTLSTQFESGIFISLRKYDKLMAAYKLTGLSSRFVAAFSDGLVYAIDVTKINTSRIKMFKREDLRESGEVGANDMEPGYMIPIEQMEFLYQMTFEEIIKYTNVNPRVIHGVYDKWKSVLVRN